MTTPSLSIILSLFLSGVVVDSAVAVDGSEIDYKPLFQKANRSAALWKKAAQQRKEENWQLRDMLEGTSTASRRLASQPAKEATYEEFYIEIPSNGVSNIANHGGPNVKVNVWWKLPRGAILQVGSASLHKVYVPISGRTLIYRDTISGDEVYLTNGIVSVDKVKLLVRRLNDER